MNKYIRYGLKDNGYGFYFFLNVPENSPTIFWDVEIMGRHPTQIELQQYSDFYEKNFKGVDK